MSPAVATPGCPHFPNCVGCPLIGVAYGEQLRRKRERLCAALASHAGIEAVDVPPVSGSPKVFGYRTQAKLVLRRSRQGVVAGIYRPGTHEVAGIADCAVHHPLINQVVAAALAEIEARDLSIYDERTGEGLLRYLAVRVSQWERRAQLIVVATGALPASLVRALRRRVRGLESVVLNLNQERGNVILGPKFVPLTSEIALTERIGALRLRSRAGAFLQANISIARRLYEMAAAWAAPAADEIVADLYCGVGALTFHLAGGGARRVFGIEEVEPAVRDAKENGTRNGFHNVRFRCGRAAETLAEVAGEVGRVDLVSLNPPRKGADEATRQAIAACRPRAIVYVSCEPSTLGRDLAWFAGAGYGLERVQPFDMFPQTEHVETLALLRARA